MAASTLVRQKDLMQGDGIKVTYSPTGAVVISATGTGSGGSSGAPVPPMEFEVGAGASTFVFKLADLDLPANTEVSVWYKVDGSSTEEKVNPNITIDPINITVDMSGFLEGTYVLRFSGVTVVESGVWRMRQAGASDAISLSPRIGVYDLGTVTGEVNLVINPDGLLTDRVYAYEIWFNSTSTAGKVIFPDTVEWADGATPDSFSNGKYHIGIDVYDGGSMIGHVKFRKANS